MNKSDNIITLAVNSSEYKIYLPNISTDYIQKKISVEKQPYELEMLQNMEGWLGTDDLIVDVGANIGNHTLYMAARIGCKVVAFEPNKNLVDALLLSVELNDLTELVTVHALGLGSEKTQGHFSREVPENIGAQDIVLGTGDIQVVPLDSFDFEQSVKLLKIDVEGMELPVLQGGVALLRKDRPLLYIECQKEKDFQKVSNYLDTLNYSYWDTFNATPTHLFRPNEQVDLEHRVSRLQLKSVQDTYQSKIQLTEIRNKLDNANKKYHEAQERILSLKEKMLEEAADHKATTNELKQLKENLDNSNLKYHEAQERILSLKEKMVEEAAVHKATMNELKQQKEKLSEATDTHQGKESELNRKNSIQNEAIQAFEKEKNRLSFDVSQLQKQLDSANQKYREVTREQIPTLKSTNHDLLAKVKKLTEERLIIEQRLIKTRASLTYQLGYQIKNATTSARGFVRLPLALWRLYRQVKKRRKLAQHKNQQSNRKICTRKAAPQVQHKMEIQAAPVEQKDSIIAKSLQTKGNATELKVACIMDEFTYGSFAPECNLKQLTPVDWKSELEVFKPEILFVESAWRGKDELWGSKVGHKSIELQNIVQWCNEHSVATIFWNKEDPVHFQTFLNTAKLFDLVFTTDLDCIHRYKAALGHERVYFLPFACQPAAHNPIELYERKDMISFAGAYYVRYPERTMDLESYLDTLPKFKPVEIYDRNYGKDDPNYKFPEKYKPFIVGTLPFDKIDLAYKGYKYAINLNSIKQSQTMFARRVFELLASNTITISNFSRGLRLMMGDLVITSDNGNQVVQRLEEMACTPEVTGKIKLAALRKVMLEHTYQQRLNYICSKVEGFSDLIHTPPSIVVLARAENQTEFEQIIDLFQSQNYKYKSLILEVHENCKLVEFESVIYIKKEHAKTKLIKDVIGDSLWVASMSTEDYYGPNYLLDIAIATQYSNANLIGKGAHYRARKDGIELIQEDVSYRPVQSLPARQAAKRTDDTVLSVNLKLWLDNLSSGELESKNGLAIDAYNYCRDIQNTTIKAINEYVDDLPVLDTGMSITHLQTLAEKIVPSKNKVVEQMLSPMQLTELLGDCKSKNIKLNASDTMLTISSSLTEGKHEYLYAVQELKPEEVTKNRELKCYLDTTPGLAVSLVFLFLDAQKQRISHVIFQANRNGTAEIPPETKWLRLGLRVLSAGETEIKGLVLGHRDLQPTEVLGKAEHLLVTNHYPSYHDLYRNGFVHSRVKAYAEKGVMVDVFRLRINEPLNSDEFEGVDVLTGDSIALDRMLSSGRYKSVLVHFLSPEMWSVIKKYIDNVKVNVWVHGAEIHPSYRREFNYETDAERDLAKLESDKRMSFWHSVLNPMPKNLHMVFVSNSFAQEVFEDLGFELPESQFSIIHNPIETEKFSYQVKPVEQRKKILSIRPFASRQYANDISVQVILELSKQSFFNELEFRIIGNGKLFDDLVKPLKKFENVKLEQRFLNHSEISEIHKEYGMFLCPTRWDSQGVSRDEAMSSGLIPITNAIAAIPEFVDEQCAILAGPENVAEMVNGITSLIKEQNKFEILSNNAAKRVREQSSKDNITNQELALFSMPQQEKINKVFSSYDNKNLNELITVLKTKELSKAEKYGVYSNLYYELKNNEYYEEALICLESCIGLIPEKENELAGELGIINELVITDENREGIYDEHQNFIKRKDDYQQYPEMVQIETLAVCNAACVFCPYPTMDRKKDKMTGELFKKIVNDLKKIPLSHKFTISLNHINEPLADSRWMDFVLEIETDLPNAGVTVISNGYLLNEKNIRKLMSLSNIISVQISLNEIEEEAHNKSMKMKGKFKKIISNLDKLHDLVTKKDVVFKVFLRRVGDYSESDAEFVKYCSERWPMFSATSRGLKDFLGQIEIGHTDLPVANSINSKVPMVGCTQWFHIVISAAGKVAACCFDGEVKWPIGDVNNQSVLDVYNSDSYRQMRSNMSTRLEAKEPCGSCTIHWGSGSGSALYHYNGK